MIVDTELKFKSGQVWIKNQEDEDGELHEDDDYEDEEDEDELAEEELEGGTTGDEEGL